MDSEPNSRPIEILLVEDNPGDVRLTQEALRAGKLRHKLHIVEDGVEAMAFLRHEGRHTSAPRPDLILLDLNLPKKDGREVLAEIGKDPDLKSIAVVVLTVSHADQDMLKAYNYRANFINKPVEVEELLRVVSFPDEFWATGAKPPDNE